MLFQQFRGQTHQEGQSAQKVSESLNVIWRWCALFTRPAWRNALLLAGKHC